MQVSPRAQLSSSQLASTPVYRLREAGKRPGYQKRGCSPQAPLRIAQAAEVPKALATVLDCRAMMTDQGDNFQILNFMVGMTSFTRLLQDCVIFPEGIRFRGGLLYNLFLVIRFFRYVLRVILHGVQREDPNRLHTYT